MVWIRNVKRTQEEKNRISETLKNWHYQRREILVRNRLEYPEPYNYRMKTARILERFPQFSDYYFRLKERGLKDGTVYKELNNLSRIQPSGDPKTDLLRIDAMKISEATGFCLKATLKAWYTFLGRGKEVENIRIMCLSRVERIPSLEEIRDIIDDDKLKLEERTFITVMWEGGFRASEILTLKRDNILLNGRSASILVNGKTGPRTVPLFRDHRLFPLNSYYLLKRYLEENPSHVWTITAYNQVEYMFSKIRCRLNLENFHSHLLRKSRATWLKMMGMPEEVILKYFGWSINSLTMMRHYFNLAAVDVVGYMERSSRPPSPVVDGIYQRTLR